MNKNLLTLFEFLNKVLTAKSGDRNTNKTETEWVNNNSNSFSRYVKWMSNNSPSTDIKVKGKKVETVSSYSYLESMVLITAF